MAMLPLIVLSLALIFFLMKVSGVMDDLAGAQRRGPARRARPGEAEAGEARRGERDSDRLRVFRDFIDRIPPPDDQDHTGDS